MHRERHKNKDQKDRLRDVHADGQTYKRLIDMQIDSVYTCRQTDMKADRHADRQKYMKAGRHVDRQD